MFANIHYICYNICKHNDIVKKRRVMPNSLSNINRKHTLNINYFQNIDSEQKAYWLGLLWADGSMSKTTPRCSGKNRLTLTQNETNKYHLEQLRYDINSSKPLRQTKSSYSSSKLFTLEINCRKLCSDLEYLGFTIKDERKSIPNIPKHLIHHFIRGYFDGDGCLSIYTQNINNVKINRQELSFTGNPEFIKKLKSYLTNTLNLSKTKIKSYKRTSKATTLRYGKISDIQKIYDYLYKDSTRFLKSKHKKFMGFQSNHGCVSNPL